MRMALVFLPVAILGAVWADGEDTPVVRGRHFATGQACAMCHSNALGADAMRDKNGRGIAPFDLWQATMMANSARDPLWRAYVSVEVSKTPSKRAAIEAKCLRCHAPMASAERGLADDAGKGFSALRGRGDLGFGVLKSRGTLGDLARDGVSCTICHQIQDKNLGEPKSFSGHYVAGGPGIIWGPHADPHPVPMQRSVRYVPKQGTHTTRSAMCATCHTLFTDALDKDGKPTGHTLPEQTPYLEWRNSVYNDEVDEPGPESASCQDCHMRTRNDDGSPIHTQIARNPGGRDFPWTLRRSPFGRHRIVGGNTLVPAILRDTDELRVAPKAAYDAVIAEARAMLQFNTADLAIEDVSRAGDTLRVRVRVRNRAGHKFPTGIPIRRAWLRIRMLDASGRVLLAWGAFDEAGRILGADGEPLATERAGGPVAPHRDRVADATQVPIYETVLEDAGGAATFTLLHGARYRKDNRLLPKGWSASHKDAKHTAPAGIGKDADFVGGSDGVVFELPARHGAAEIQVTLLYQTLGARAAAELFTNKTPEVETFRRLYEAADRRPVVVAAATRAIRR